MEDDKPKQADWKMGLVMVIFRLLDAGLAPWVMVCMFLLGAEWIGTRTLNSQDTLKFLSQLFGRTGFAWFGWIVALIEVPLFAWTLRRENRRHRDMERLVGEEGAKARDLLKQQKQEELKLK